MSRWGYFHAACRARRRFFADLRGTRCLGPIIWAFFKIGGYELADKLRCGATLSMYVVDITARATSAIQRMTPGLYNILQIALP